VSLFRQFILPDVRGRIKDLAERKMARKKEEN
jgi:hypothetical protein